VGTPSQGLSSFLHTGLSMTTMSTSCEPVWGKGRKVFKCVDLHCGGEPARNLLSGAPTIPGSSVMEKRKYFIENLDHIRQVLLTEPRGYPCQNLNILVPATSPDADIGYIIAEQNTIYPLFSGHNTICVATAVLETGLVLMQEPETRLKLEAPGGIIDITAKCSNGRVMEVAMTAMPSFVCKTDVVLNVPTVGKVVVDIAFGGMWYVIVKAEQLGIQIKPENGKRLSSLGEMIKVSAIEQCPVSHPNLDYPGPDILVFTTPPPPGSQSTGRNTVVMSNGVLDWSKPETFTAMLDRSPCGSGTAAVMATLHHRGELQLGEEFVHESILGTVFKGKLVEKTKVGGFEAVVPVVAGRAYITGVGDQIVEPDDPLPYGYTVADIWC